jgi:enoyl-CoA hydratase/carnithine racemase
VIQLDIDSQGIATLAINQPARAMNVIDWEFVRTLGERIDQIAQNPNTIGVIVTSGKGTFVAGADLAIMGEFVAPGVTPKDAADMIGRVGNTLRRLETIGKPVVGASTGTSLGGGLEILLACHYRVAADKPEAVYGLPEVSLGLLPGAGGTQRLPRLIGIAKALPLMLSGSHFNTQEALEMGIFNQVVPSDQLLATAKKVLLDGLVPSVAPWDQKGFRMPGGDSSTASANALFLMLNAGIFSRTHGKQPAPKAIASCVYEGARLPINRALRIEQMYFGQLVQAQESQAMIQTLFFSRQALEKAPGRPQGIPKAKLKRIAVQKHLLGGDALKKAAEAAGIEVDSEPTDASELVIGQAKGALMAHWYQVKDGDLPAVLELAASATTSEKQLALGFDLARQLRAVPVLLNQSASGDWQMGYVQACIEALLATATTLIEAGTPAVVVNNAAIAAGWPALFELARSIGQDWSSRDQKLGHARPSLQSIADELANSQHQLANKAVRVKALLTSDAANLAAVLGAGFPRHLGGPLFLTEAV